MARICDMCGKEISDGMTDDQGSFYCCQECFTAYMNRDCGEDGWRDVEDDGCGGYYEVRGEDGKWYGTGIYWTEWED